MSLFKAYNHFWRAVYLGVGHREVYTKNLEYVNVRRRIKNMGKIGWFGWAVLLCLQAAAFSGCAKGEGVGGEKGKAEPPRAESVEVFQSVFMSELAALDRGKPDPAPKPKPFRWDFKGPGELSYVIAQSTKTVASISSKEGEVQNYSFLRGELKLKPSGGRAAVEFSKLVLQGGPSPSTNPHDQSYSLPPMNFTGMGEDGEGLTPQTGQETLVRFFLPVPGRQAEGSAPLAIPIVIPLATAGFNMPVNGVLNAVYEGVVDYEGRRAARYGLSLSIDENTPPPGVSGAFSLKCRGRGVVYFDEARGAVAEAALALRLAVDGEIPERAPPGDRKLPPVARTNPIRFDSDNFFMAKLLR